MNVGDYVRTREYIRKIRKIERDYIYCDIGVFTENEIIKTSPQIIDLIEVGDFITYKQGNFYWNVFEQVSGRYNRENEMTDLIVDNKPLSTVEILTVITHEQMEAMQYRVEE